jgi:hypothetical protein
MKLCKIAIHNWIPVRSGGALTYWQCESCGKRSVSQGYGCGPVDMEWIETGVFKGDSMKPYPKPTPPTGSN